MLTERDKKAMNFPSFTAEYVESKVSFPDFFTQGKQYQKEKRVKNLRNNNKFSRFTATVKGTRDYSLVVCFRNGKLTRHTCTCPAHEKYDGPCKHVVAVMLEILMRRERAWKRYNAENPSSTTISVSPQKTVIYDSITPPKTAVSPPQATVITPPPPKPQQTTVTQPPPKPQQTTVTPPDHSATPTLEPTYTHIPKPKASERIKNGLITFAKWIKIIYEWCIKHLKQIILFIIFGLPLIDGIRSAVLYSFLEGVKVYFIGVAVSTAVIILVFIFSKILDWLLDR